MSSEPAKENGNTLAGCVVVVRSQCDSDTARPWPLLKRAVVTPVEPWWEVCHTTSTRESAINCMYGKVVQCD